MKLIENLLAQQRMRLAMSQVSGRRTDELRNFMTVLEFRAINLDNRARISTRLKQLRTGKRYAQAPPSNVRRLLSNIEFLGGRDNSDDDVDLEVGANFLAIESRSRGTHLWGGRTTYRLRRRGDELLLAYKKVVLVDNDQPLPTLGFLI